MIDYSKIDSTATCVLTDEEKKMEAEYAKEYEEHFLQYSKLADQYRALIDSEYDSERKIRLFELLHWLHEDNK